MPRATHPPHALRFGLGAHITALAIGAALAVPVLSGCGSEAEASEAEDAAEADAEQEKPSAIAEVVEKAREAAEAGGPKYDPRKSLAPMIEAVGPAVVSIRAYGKGGLFGRLGGKQARGSGSGFVLEADGIIVTNHHVVAGADRLEVRLADGRTFDAQLLGSDEATDIAVLALDDAEGLPTVTLGQSEALRVGDWVVAIGSPLGLEHSASVGIVSGRGRGSLGLYRDSYLDFLQTDADIAPGSSGGPLFDLEGRVVGITTAVGGQAGPGFAIPIDQAKPVVATLRENGEVTRGWLGAASEPGDDAAHDGAHIGKVFGGTPAADAGLRAGDVVTQMDGKAIETFEQLRAHIAALPPGHTVLMTVERDGETLELAAVLAERPDGDALSKLRPARRSPPKTRKPRTKLPTLRAPKRLGIQARDIGGALEVVDIEPGSLADQLELRPGDVLERIDGTTISDPADVSRALSAAGNKLTVEIVRDGKLHRITFERS